MKGKLFAVTLAGMLNIQVSNACIGDGGVDGALFAVPAGTFEVAVASYNAQIAGKLPKYPRHNLVTVQFLLEQALNQNYQKEIFDVTLFEATGQHFFRFIGDGERVEILAHEVPKNEFDSVMVTDIDALTALVRKELTFTEADSLNLFYQAESSKSFYQLLSHSF
ncbi:hypothetical protein KP803_21395 [Vibrio sp. ZSDE26]|uniref:Uncharacterized protein n=1 Tax=Vibrio amylolyticus TaxID=2847292 RepID=A0A9X2BK29_9VIBR|nr:hypothetical protein [Vibrio amylolyticus]MCK6265820.1 hypothetical protein [Vibrio amylolyticus]